MFQHLNVSACDEAYSTDLGDKLNYSAPERVRMLMPFSGGTTFVPLNLTSWPVQRAGAQAGEFVSLRAGTWCRHVSCDVGYEIENSERSFDLRCSWDATGGAQGLRVERLYHRKFYGSWTGSD